MTAAVVMHFRAREVVAHGIEPLLDHIHVVGVDVDGKARGQSPFGDASARSGQARATSLVTSPAELPRSMARRRWHGLVVRFVVVVVDGKIDCLLEGAAQTKARGAAVGTGVHAGEAIAAVAREAAHGLDDVGAGSGRAADGTFVVQILEIADGGEVSYGGIHYEKGRGDC